MINQKITKIDMRDADRQSIHDLAEAIIEASKQLDLQGFKVKISAASTCSPSRLCKKCKNCNAF